MKERSSNSRLLVAVFLATGVFGGVSGFNPAFGQITPDQAAQMTLTSAQKAFNERNYPFAVQRYKEFLSKFGGHKEAPTARFGLALALLEMPDKSYNEIRDLLQNLAGNKDFPEHPHVLYRLGMTLRALGIQALALADARPPEATQQRNVARDRFDEAGRQYAAALAAFTTRAGAAPEAGKDLTPDWEWAARARCDHAEMLLRVQKIKEAQAAAAPFVKDAVLARSKYRDLGRYYFGFASFLLNDMPTAEKTLGMLAPFTDLQFGPHARYLLARVHHQAGERTEATTHYEGVLNDYLRNRKLAQDLLRQPEKFKNDPLERAKLEALVKEAIPDHVQRASFYLGVLLYEAGRFAEAQTRFLEFPKLFEKSPLRIEAEVRLGFCQVQLKEFAQAIKTLAPLVDKDRRLSDQVLLWLGKAQVGAAPDAAANPAGNQQALLQGLATLRQAAERAQQAMGMDNEARERRAEILVEIGDTMQLLKQFKEAANVYQNLVNEKVLPQRDEEIQVRLATALHLAGDYNEADRLCVRFQEKYPQSTLLSAIAFRHAENGYFRIAAADKNPNPAERAKEVVRLCDEAIKRYEAVLAKYPESPQINVARYSLGLTHYRKGDFTSCQKTLGSIPEAERGGELALAPYLMADCILRLTPTAIPDDALAAGKMEEQLKTAAGLLDGFIGGNPVHPQTPDAFLKLGMCQQRQAALMAQPPERAKVLMTARATYEKLLGNKQYANHPLLPQALFERAKCIGQVGDVNAAINELRRFTTDPLRASPVAPLAQLQLATLLRGQNKAKEAVDLLAKAREQYEPLLGKDPERAGWIVLLRYHHGVALREANQQADARKVFDQVIRQAGSRPEAADAALRYGQCLREESHQKFEAWRKALATAKNPEQVAAARKIQDEGFKLIRDSVQYLENQAEQLKKVETVQEVRAKMLYEAAWGARELAEPEVVTAREALTKEAWQKLGPQASKFPPPEIPLAKVPLQPAEKKARGHYQALIAQFAELPLATDARFELAELLSQRHEHDEAIKLLTESLDREPPQEMTEKIRLRLGSAHAAKGNLKTAMAQFDTVAQNPKSSLLPQAHYRAGECLLQNGQFEEAAKRLLVFRDQGPYQNIPGLTDRALLRLGHTLAHLKRWDESRQVLERAVNMAGSGPWVDEARYALGWAMIHQGQLDPAVNVFAQVAARNATELGAKAQLQIGLCRLAQKRFAEAANALLVVPFTYDYPDLGAAALIEAARAQAELKKTDEAVKLLERVLRVYPHTRWAEVARERLEGLKGSDKK